jgi:hypothetical protein
LSRFERWTINKVIRFQTKSRKNQDESKKERRREKHIYEIAERLTTPQR